MTQIRWKPEHLPDCHAPLHLKGIRNFWLIKCQRCKEENLSQRIIWLILFSLLYCQFSVSTFAWVFIAMLTREDSESWASVKAVLVHAQSGHLHNIPLVRNRSNSLGAHTRIYRQSCGYVSPAGSALPWPCAQGDVIASKQEYPAPSGYLRPKPHHGQLWPESGTRTVGDYSLAQLSWLQPFRDP